MRNSVYRAGILATTAVLGYLGNPSEAYAQDKKDTTKAPVKKAQVIQNKIYSGNERNSAADDGVYLKNYVYDLNLSPNSRINLDSMFNLHATRGGIRYTAVDARRELLGRIAYLEGNKDSTAKEKASINYLKSLLVKTPRNNANSVRALNKSIENKVIDETDSLFTASGSAIKDDRYTLVATSPGNSVYKSNSIPIMIDVKTSNYTSGKSTDIVTPRPLTQAEKEDSTRLVQGLVQGLDSIAKANAREEFLKDSLANRTHFLEDSLQQERDKSVRKRHSPMRVTLDYVVGLDEPTLNAAFVARGGRVGIGGRFLGPFSLTASYLQRNDVNVQNLRIPLGTRVGVGIENHTGLRANGYGVEAKVKFLLLGVEKVFEGYNRELDERIETQTGAILSRNQNSVAERRETTNFHVGLDIKRLRLQAEKNTKNNLAISGGLRFGPSRSKGKR